MRVGSAALPVAPQGEDHPLVARLHAAGAVVIGLTNLPELGFPAASVPAGGAGMPGAVQLVAAPGGEQALLALAAQLERARPWPRHAPGYSGSLRPSWEASKPRDS